MYEFVFFCHNNIVNARRNLISCVKSVEFACSPHTLAVIIRIIILRHRYTYTFHSFIYTFTLKLKFLNCIPYIGSRYVV